jgi:hypothetical protein
MSKTIDLDYLKHIEVSGALPESTFFLNEIVEFVRNNPNDMELGKKVRQFVGENSELIVDYINRENQKYLKYMQE